MLVSLASGLVLAQAFFWGQEIFENYSGENSEIGIKSEKRLPLPAKLLPGII